MQMREREFFRRHCPAQNGNRAEHPEYETWKLHQMSFGVGDIPRVKVAATRQVEGRVMLHHRKQYPDGYHRTASLSLVKAQRNTDGDSEKFTRAMQIRARLYFMAVLIRRITFIFEFICLNPIRPFAESEGKGIPRIELHSAWGTNKFINLRILRRCRLAFIPEKFPFY